jgi:hypothetical protein
VKTQIIQLNQNDDCVSVRDKMNWCQTGRILLVWPLHGRVLDRQLDLILVKRYASSLGSDLALATDDAEVRFSAKQIGIPVFTDLRQAQDQDWVITQQEKIDHPPKSSLLGLDHLRKSIGSQTPDWIEHPVAKIICLGFSVLALASLAIFLLPGARVSLSPKQEVQSIKLNLIADPSINSINLFTGSVPTYSQEITVEETDSISSTGTMTIPDKPATVMLEFVNHSDKVLTLPVGTIISTLGSNRIRFKTISPVETKATPGTPVLVEAVAIRPGTSGNLPSNSLVAIEGKLGIDFSVTNPTPTSGGLDATVPVPSEQDLQTLRSKLITKLIQRAMELVQSKLPADDTLIISSATISDIAEETYSPPIGMPAEQVKLFLRAKIVAQIVSGGVLRNMATPFLDSSIPIGYTPVVNSMSFTSLGPPALGSDGKIHWSVNATRKLNADISSIKTVESIRWLTKSKAAERLSAELPIAKPPQIKLLPMWWPRMPILAMRITLEESVSQ